MVKFYSEIYHNKDEEKGFRHIRWISSANIFKDRVIISYFIILSLLFISFFLLVYLKGQPQGFAKINTISMISVYFPSFNFSFNVMLILLTVAIEIIIFKHYRINFLFLLEIDPDINLSAKYMFKVRIY